MKKILLLTKLFVLAAVVSGNAQINFDELEMPSYKNGSDGAGKFVSGEATFVNYYNSEYNSWSGFAVSKANDVTTSGYGNQYSAITGTGFGDENFMLTYVSPFSEGTYIKLGSAQNLVSMSVTNSTYAHNSIRDGDAVGKQFGGDSGNDPDYFLLSIIGYNETVRTDSVGFYLADFQDADNANDYIIDAWGTVNLNALGTVDSLVFELTSTDNGAWGMNTPAYFCMDNLVTASETLDFAEYDFDYWNGEDLTGGFQMNGGMGSDGFFHNNFTASSYGGYWSGFAYSQKNDILTEGYSNQYAAITGTDASGFGVYVVGNTAPGIKFSEPTVALDLKVTNSTYAALSMQNGDMFAKQFGGDSGNDEDWFLLTIEGFNNDNSEGTEEFYLADYRFSDNSQDYIIDTWETVHLSFSTTVDSIAFSLSSSDVGGFGMNTPAYFCMDELGLTHVGIENIQTSDFNVFPNPANDFVVVEAENITEIYITDLSGKLVYQNIMNSSRTKIDLSSFGLGIYILSVKDEQSVYTQKLVIE